MPAVPPPDMVTKMCFILFMNDFQFIAALVFKIQSNFQLLSLEELRDRRLTDPRLPR